MAEFKEYIRRPFKIEATQITEENIHEMCELVGHDVREKNGKPFIVVNRHVVPFSDKAYPGWWVTKFGDNLRCYPDKVFRRQFTDMNPDWEPHLEQDNRTQKPEDEGEVVEPPTDTVEEADDVAEA